MKQLRSFINAFSGFFAALKSEPHLRFHIVAATYVFLFAYLGEFTCEQWAVLVITVAAVIAAELVNTTIEDLCDLYSTDYNKKIKRIKDIAAASVLIFSAGAAAVALCLFVFTGALSLALSKLIAAPLWFIPLGASAVMSVMFILLFGKKSRKHITTDNKDSKNNNK